MKKLNITKETFEKSKYFTKKYGTLKFVSESGRLFKTDKGQVLRFDEGMKREVMPMNGRKSFGHKAIEEEDDDGFTLFSYETPVARLERREDGSGLDFTLLNDYLSTTTLTHIHSWLIGHNQQDIPTKKLLQMNVGDSVPMMAAESKKLVKEGAGSGYTVKIKDLKFGNIIDKKLVKGKERYDDYYECKVEIVPGEYEIEAEDYYNDFFWQEHEFGDTPTAKIDGGVATIAYSTNSYDEDEADDELRHEVAGRTLDISFDYGWGWTHVDLPREKIEADHVDVEGHEFYGSIDKIELNAPDLADAVNSGYQSTYDKDEEEEEEEEDAEEYDESSWDDAFKASGEWSKNNRDLDEKLKAIGRENQTNRMIGNWRVFDYGEDFPYTERYTALDPDGYSYFISHNGGVGSFTDDPLDGTSEEICDELEVEIEDKMWKPVELSTKEISDNRIVMKGLKLIKVKYEYEEDENFNESAQKKINLTWDEYNKLWDLIDMDWKRWNKSDPDNINIVANRALEHLEWVTSTKLGTNNPKDVRISFTIPSALPDDEFSTGRQQSMTIYELIDGMCWS